MTIPIIDMEATGRNIKQFRRERGMTVSELREVFGFTNPQAIYRWESGGSLPTIDNLVILASVLGVTIDEILIME